MLSSRVSTSQKTQPLFPQSPIFGGSVYLGEVISMICLERENGGCSGQSSDTVASDTAYNWKNQHLQDTDGVWIVDVVNRHVLGQWRRYRRRLWPNIILTGLCATAGGTLTVSRFRRR